MNFVLVLRKSRPMIVCFVPCVEPSPPTHLMCIDQFHAFYFYLLVILLLFPPTFVSTSFCPTYKRGKTVPEFCSYVNIILHTHTHQPGETSPIIFLARITPPSLNPFYYVFGKNCASPCSVTRFKVESLMINCRKLDIII